MEPYFIIVTTNMSVENTNQININTYKYANFRVPNKVLDA